jgi:hypothetical protein
MNITILPFYLIAILLLPNAIKETVQLYQRLNTWYNRPKPKRPKWAPRPPKKSGFTLNAIILQHQIKEKRREAGETIEPVAAIEMPACLTTGVHPAVRANDTSERFRAITGKL